MIGIELWRARIGLYNSSRRFSSILSSLFSPSRCSYGYYQHRKRRRTVQDYQHTNGDSLVSHTQTPHSSCCETTTRSSLFSVSSSLTLCRSLVLLLLVTAVILVTPSINSGPATSGGPIVELVVDPHGSSLCIIDSSITSSAQYQSALILLKEDQFVEKHLHNNNKKFFQSALRDWLPRDDDKPSAAVLHAWDDINVSVSQADHDGALVNSTCARESCSSGIAHVSHQLLVLSGDVEVNPGPKHGVDETPKMFDLQCMSYTGEDGKIVDFRLKDRLLRKWKDLAYALKFPAYVIDTIKKEDDPLDQLLMKWLQGDNKTEDLRPITWGTLIAALRHSNFQEEVNILEKHFVQDDPVSTAAPQSDLQKKQLEAAQKLCQEQEKEISLLKVKLWSMEKDIIVLKTNLKVSKAREKRLQDCLADVTEYASRKQQELKKEMQNEESAQETDRCLSLPPEGHPLQKFSDYLKNTYLDTKPHHVLFESKDKCLSRPFILLDCDAIEYTMIKEGIKQVSTEKLATIDIGRKYSSVPDPAKNIVVVHPSGVEASLLCHAWAKGELLQRWPVVIRVELHEKRIREDKNVDNLVYHPEQTLREVIIKELETSQGKEVLFILDGYDQLSDKQKEACFVFQKLIMRKHFPKATLMVLTVDNGQEQHANVQQVIEALPEKFCHNIDQYIKILKLSDNDIHQYATAICNEDPDLNSALNSFLSSRSFSYFQLYTPLQCTILTDLYCFHWKNGDKIFAPRTRTELYTDLVRTLLVQYLSSHSEYSKREWHILEFTDLPGEVYEQFKALAQLAARGIQEREYVFDSGVPEDTLGLMYQVDSDRSVSYSFLYLPLQEYLAAHYCSLEESEDRLKQVIGLPNPLQDFLSLRSKNSLRYHWQVLLFTAGITKLHWNPNVLNWLISQKCGHSQQAQFIAGSMCLVYETQSPELMQSTLSFQHTTKDKYLKLEDVAKTPHELFVAGYYIPYSNRLWVYSQDDITKSHFQELLTGLGMSSSNGDGQIANLAVTVNELSVLLSLMPSTNATQKIAKVTICDSDNDVENGNFNRFSLCFPHLEELEISAAFSEDVLQLFIALPELKSLQKLCITFRSKYWNNENISTVCERLQACSFRYLEINNSPFPLSFTISCKLEALLLSRLKVAPELARCFGMKSTALRTLRLDDCYVSRDADTAFAFVESLKSPHCVLETIELRDSYGYQELLKELKNGPVFITSERKNWVTFKTIDSCNR